MTDHERTEAYLRLILDRVDGWLRFAEVKNAGLIALSGTVTTALLAALRDLGDLSAQGRPLIVVATVLFLVAMAVGVYSYLPRLRPVVMGAGGLGVPGDGDNLFYYGDVAKYAPEALVEAVSSRYVAAAPTPKAPAAATKQSAASLLNLPSRPTLHLAGQATVNAQITLRKMKLFERGATLVLLGSLAYAAALMMPPGSPAAQDALSAEPVNAGATAAPTGGGR